MKEAKTKRTFEFKKGSELLTKSAEAVSGAMTKTSDISKKVAVSMQSTINDWSEKAKNDRYQRDLKKYNPLFLGEYASEAFNIPNIIVIRDDAERRDIEVCKGAIGWREKTKDNVEILYLYDEFVPHCGLHFIPTAECNSIYCVDSFDRSRFIRADTIFHKAHEEKMAELRHIAFSLGAKSCSIEISESDSQVESAMRKSSTREGLNAGSVKAGISMDAEQYSSHKGKSHRSGHSESKWSGDQERVHPTLKWFQHEETILKLIDTCLSGNNYIQSEMLLLEGSSVATMSQKTAIAVDATAGKSGMSGNSKNSNSMEAQASKESRSKLIFFIEF